MEPSPQDLDPAGAASSPRQNVVLIGFMGAGKSTIGERVAKGLGFTFVDTDSLIEKREGKSIPKIFADSGESGFRERESAALESLASLEHIVLATGGGIVTVPSNAALLRELGFVVWLNSGEDAIFRRVSKNQNRPLLRTPRPRETIRDLLREREPLYRACADLEIDTTDLTEDEIAFGICESARVRWANTNS